MSLFHTVFLSHVFLLFSRIPGAGGRKKVFRLSDVVQPLSDTQIEKLTSGAVKRILHSEKAIAQSGMSHVSTRPTTDLSFSYNTRNKWLFHEVLCKSARQVRVKILSRLVTQFEGMMKEDVLEFILEDIRTRSDLAFSLLYQEYNTYLSQMPTGLLDSYDHCLFTLLSGLQEKPEQRDG